VLVNNSTNIIIKNDHLSPQIIEYKNDHDIYNVGNSDPGLEQAQQCGRAKSFNRINKGQCYINTRFRCFAIINNHPIEILGNPI
jgi:hypothetical protein